MPNRVTKMIETGRPVDPRPSGYAWGIGITVHDAPPYRPARTVDSGRKALKSPNTEEDMDRV